MALTSRYKHLIALAVILIGFLVFWKSGLLNPDPQYFRSLANSPWLPVILIVAIASAWTFALPASVFFFIVPLFYDPLPSTAIVVLGAVLAGLAGYSTAKTFGAQKIERYRDHRVTRLLSQHSHFAALFAIRVVPSSPNALINYGAGVLQIPLGRFLVATALATAIKGFIYALAVHSALGAQSLSDALTWESIAALFGFAALALGGRMLKQKWMTPEAKE